MTPARFEELVLKASPVAVVAFTKLGDRACVDVSRRLASSAIKGVNGRVSLMEVNASSPEGAKLAERYAPEFFSATESATEGSEDDEKCVAAVLFPHGTDKEDADPDTYDGDVDDAEAFAAWVREAIPDFTMPLPQPKLVEAFMQNDPFAPKIVLFADAKPDSALGRDFIALAANFHQDFQFATIPSGDKQNAAKFGVRSYPSLMMMFVPPLKGGENPDTNTVQMQVAQFPGHQLDYLYMHSWLDQLLVQVLGKDPRGAGGDGGPKKKGAADPVKLVGTPKELDAECGGAGLCVVAFVPQGTEDTELRTAIVQAAADDKSDRPVKFVVVDPVEQRSFAAAFEVTADDVPAVSVVSMRKNRFATYRATFSAERIAGFLDDVLSAKQRTQMIQEIPKLVPGGEEPEEVFDEDVEEEFDLADIMGEDVQGEVTNEERLSRIERELAEEEAEKKRKKAEEEDAAAAAKKASKKKKKKKRKGKAHSEL